VVSPPVEGVGTCCVARSHARTAGLHGQHIHIVQEVHAYLRNWMADNVSPSVAESVRILYGGSVKSGNCVEIGALEDVDGFLVGGAALDGPEFAKICNARAGAAASA